MIIVVANPDLTHSTDPTAAAVTAGFRPASLTPATANEKAPACSAQLDVDSLYPNLSAAAQAPRRTGAIARVLAALRPFAPSR